MAFCESCGAKLREGAAFCPNCGQSTQATAPVNPAPSAGEDLETFIKGVLSIVLCELGIPGIVLGALAKRSAAKWLSFGRPLNWKIKVGRILGRFGFILGILATVLWIFYALFLILVFVIRVKTPSSFFF